MSNSLRTRRAIGRPRCAAFTLIELLVVIAIIALLAAILFPVFTRARDNARRTVCQSNLKQMGLGMQMYAQDSDDIFPRAFAYGTVTSWDTEIEEYVAQKVGFSNVAPLFQCPNDTISRSGTGGYARTYALTGAIVPPDPIWSYTSGVCPAGDIGDMPDGFAGPISADPGGDCYSRGRNLSEFPDPTGTLMMTEMPNVDNLMSFTNDSVVTRPVSVAASKSGCPSAVSNSGNTCGQDEDVTTPIHFDGWNYLFVDGHVKWYRPEDTVGRGSVTVPKGMWTIAPND